MIKSKITLVDENWKEIAPSINVDNVQLDSEYDFSKYAEKSIKTSDGRQFELTATPENIKGIASKDEVVVKLVYREIVKPAAKTTTSTPTKEKTATPVSNSALYENNTLPKAGEVCSHWYTVIGVAMIALGTSVVAIIKKLKSSQKD